MKKIFFCLVLLYIGLNRVEAVNIKNLEWLKPFNGDSIDTYSVGTCDNQGNIFLCMKIKSPVLNLGNGKIFSSQDTNNNNFVLAGYNNDGICQMFEPVNFKSSEFTVKSMCADNSGNLLLIGYAKILDTDIDFGNGKIITGKTNKSIILIKYSPAGECIWAKCFDGDYQTIDGRDVCFDKDDNIFISGCCNNIDFGNGKKFNNKLPKGGHFMAEFNKDGVCQWAKQLTTQDNSLFNGSINSIRYGTDQTLYVYGYFKFKMDFGDGKYISKFDTATTGWSIFVANYNPDGKLNWVKVYGSNFPYDLSGNATTNDHIQMDTDNNNNMYITGHFNSDGYFAAGYPIKHIQDTVNNYFHNIYSNCFLAKCNSKGNLSWVRTFNGGYQGGCHEGIFSILAEDVNSIYFCGDTFSDSINIDGYKFNNRRTGLSGYIAGFDSAGKCHELNTLSSHGFGISNLFKDNYKNLFAFGAFWDSLETNNTYYTINNRWPLFIAKYGNGCGLNSFSYNDFSDTKKLSLVSSAQKIDSVVRLTPAIPQKQGALWNTEPVYVRNGFTTEFKFRFSKPYNAFEDGSIPGADGIAFVIQSVNPTACGTNGGGIGFEGIANSLAVEFDTYRNSDPPYNDADGNHIAVFCNGKQPNTSNHKSTANLGTTNNIIPIRADSTVYYAKIDYIATANKLEIYLDSTGLFSKPVLTIDSIDLSKLIDLQDGLKAFSGITSATGTSYENQDILEWTVCSSAINSMTDAAENTLIADDNDFGILPNPAESVISINLPQKYQISQIKIYSVEGIEVYNSNCSGTGMPVPYCETIKINVSSFTPGVYYVKVGDRVCKFVKI